MINVLHVIYLGRLITDCRQRSDTNLPELLSIWRYLESPSKAKVRGAGTLPEAKLCMP